MISKSEREIIRDKYNKGMTCKQIGNAMNIREATIAYHVRNMGISRGRGSYSSVSNQDYFDIIDSEDKAYWLGYLMADGNISIYNNQYSIKLHISANDSGIIYRFIKYVKTSNKPIYREDTNSYYLSISSKHMVNMLISYGFKTNKTGSEVIPNLNNEMTHHFVRGYFDGDGITCVTDGNLRSGFVGGENIIYDLHNITKATQKIYYNNGAYYFQGGIKYSKNLYEYMYRDATIWLERKRNRMDIICGNTEVTK